MYDILKASFKDARRVLLILVVASLVPSIAFLSPTASILPSAYAAGVLTGISVMPSDQTINQQSYYTVQFTTATTAIIHTITVTYPAGFNVAGTKLIEVSGIGSGSLSISGQTLTYTIASPVSVAAGKAIKLMFGNIKNGATTSNTVAISTIDGGVPIDSGTGTFALTQITNSMIATSAVTNSKLAANSVSSSKITDGQVALVDLAPNSVDGGKVVDNSLTADDLAGFSVTSAELAPNSVDSGKIVDGSVALADLAANSVNSGTIVDGSIVAADVNTGFINFVTKADGTDGWNPDGVVVNFSITNSGAGTGSRVVVTLDNSSPTTCGVYDQTSIGIHNTFSLFRLVPVTNIHCDGAPADGAILKLGILNP